MADQTYEEKIAEIEAKAAADREKRAAFLKDATPIDVLTWLMRHPDSPSKIQAYCAKALLPYQQNWEKDAIEPPGADKS